MDHRVVTNFNMGKKAATLFQGNQTRQKQLKQENKAKSSKSKIKILK